MKKLMFCAMIALMMLSAVPSQLKAADKTKSAITATTKSDVSTEAALAARLDEIKAMDMSTLSRSEKKELKSEVKAIKSHQDEVVVVGHHHHHGAYIGIGGVLLVVLIVILIV
jgi:poly-gamma-glutamate capsule biosynthesis protein CapA/YwtB (metallophosphatase superfamily)